MTGAPDDRTLTETGLAPGRNGRILLIACGALAREILDLRAANGWTHLDLTCLPAKLHLYPEKITAAVEETVEKHRADYDGIFVVYADCGTGGLLAEKCRALGVEMVAGPHCYAFFEGNDRFAEHAETEIAGVANEGEAFEIGTAITALIALRAAGLIDQACLLIPADGGHFDTGAARKLADCQHHEKNLLKL